MQPKHAKNNTMKKILFISYCLITFFSYKSNAQQKYSLSFGGGYASYKATDNTKNTSGFGLDLTAKAALSDKVDAFAQTGYNAYLNNGFNVAFIPLLIGANMKFDNFATGLGMGYGSSTAGGSTKGGFTISPQLSYHFNNLDLVVHYTSTKTNAASTWNMFGFKIMHKIF